MNILKYFKQPKGIIKNSERWKYNIAEILKSMFYACLIIALSAGAVTVFMYALLTPDY
jgi:hypothetical protein